VPPVPSGDAVSRVFRRGGGEERREDERIKDKGTGVKLR